MGDRLADLPGIEGRSDVSLDEPGYGWIGDLPAFLLDDDLSDLAADLGVGWNNEIQKAKGKRQTGYAGQPLRVCLLHFAF